VSGARGGFVWKIALDSTGYPTDRPDTQPDKPTGQKRVFDVQIDRTRPTGQPDKTDRPTGQSEDFAARYVTQIEAENRFLKLQIEEGNRNAAELRASLRAALSAMPKQLTSGTPETAPESPTATAKRADEGLDGASGNEAGNGEVSSYGALADWLENQMDGR
jgi:hypothetical protein